MLSSFANPAPEGNDSRSRLAAQQSFTQQGERLAFELAEKRFAPRFEHLGNRHPDRFFNQLIEVEKRAIELCREELADR
jgi:hypothetical protein